MKFTIFAHMIYILLLTLLPSLLFAEAWDGTAKNTNWYVGHESDETYTLSAAKDLAGLAKLVNDGNDFSEKIVKLGANIVLNNTEEWKNWYENSTGLNEWVAIGTESCQFRGTFDGDGYAVSGVYISNSNDYQGLFGYLGYKGTIKNLRMEAFYIKGKNYVGALTGSNSYNDGDKDYITNSYATGNVKGTERVGGLVGYSNGPISNSYATGNVMGTESVGGLVGYNYDGLIINSYAAGNVTGGGNVGGLVGHNDGGIVINSYYKSETSDIDDGRGISKTLEDMRRGDTFEGWDFNNTWYIGANINDGLPYLISGTFPETATIEVVYKEGLILADVEFPSAGYQWIEPATPLSAGAKKFDAIHMISKGEVNVNVAKATGTFATPEAINTTYTPTLTLEDLTPPANYAWDTPATSLSAGNGQKFPAKYTDPSGNYTPATGEITVNVAKATGTFATPEAINAAYTPALTLENLTPPANYAWNTPATSLSAGDGQKFPATYTDPSENYTSAEGEITVNIAKAIGTFVTPEAINTTYASTLTLEDLPLANYTWSTPATSLSAGDDQKFPATYTDPSENYTSATGEITVNVAKNAGSPAFITASAIQIVFAENLTLEKIKHLLLESYSWANPETAIASAGEHEYEINYTDQNYSQPATGKITVTVLKNPGMEPAFPEIPAINATFKSNLTLADITLPSGYSWAEPTTAISSPGNNLQFNATHTNSYYAKASNGKITLNVIDSPEPIRHPQLSVSGFRIWQTAGGVVNVDLGYMPIVPVALKIYDLKGKLVATELVRTRFANVKVGVPSGIYLFKAGSISKRVYMHL